LLAGQYALIINGLLSTDGLLSLLLMKVILVGRSDGVFTASRRVDSQFIGAVGEGHPAVLIVFRYDRLDLNFD